MEPGFRFVLHAPLSWLKKKKKANWSHNWPNQAALNFTYTISINVRWNTNDKRATNVLLLHVTLTQ